MIRLLSGNEAVARGAWEAGVTLASDSLDVRVTGEAGVNIYWVATVRTAEVQIP